MLATLGRGWCRGGCCRVLAELRLAMTRGAACALCCGCVCCCCCCFEVCASCLMGAVLSAAATTARDLLCAGMLARPLTTGSGAAPRALGEVLGAAGSLLGVAAAAAAAAVLLAVGSLCSPRPGGFTLLLLLLLLGAGATTPSGLLNATVLRGPAATAAAVPPSQLTGPVRDACCPGARWWCSPSPSAPDVSKPFKQVMELSADAGGLPVWDRPSCSRSCPD